MTRDYYEVLSVNPGASDKEIRAAYKRLARKYHPDANKGSKSAEESFKAVSEAYYTLSDSRRRSQYDAMRVMGGRGGSFRPGAGGTGWPFGGFDFDSAGTGSAGGGFENLGGIFADLFGRAGPAASGPRRGQDLEYEAAIDFNEAMRGTTITIPLARLVTCTTCRGSGASGRGRRGAPGVCRRCEGEGVVRSSRTISARIPAGAQDRSRVRISGGGDAGQRGGPPGDLYVVLQVRPHSYFRREDDSIVLDVPLSYTEAALGAKVTVPTLTGKATVNIPPGTASGQRLRLRGKGVPSRDGRSRGDQIVVVSIVPPRNVKGRPAELLRELEEYEDGDPRRDLDW
jgi:molecular chaperone DnaJ